MGLVLCNCRQTRSTEVGISPGPSRCKDGGRGVVMNKGEQAMFLWCLDRVSTMVRRGDRGEYFP